MKTYSDIRSVINEAMEVQRDYEAQINVSSKMKYIEILLLAFLSYADGVSALMEAKKYDSVMPICRSFLEIYPLLIYMLENFDDNDEFSKYLNKLIVDDMIQDKKTYISMETDSTILSSDDKDTNLASYVIRWENMINQFFPDKIKDIDTANKADSLMSIIKELEKFYKSEYRALCENKNDFIGNTIKNNEELNKYLGKKYEGANVVYRLLCSETHGNIGSLDEKVTYGGFFMANCSAKNTAEACVDLVYWSIKHVKKRLEELLKKEFVVVKHFFNICG